MSNWSLDDFTKSRFARLLKIFVDISDVERITRAFGLAAKAYKGQFKKGQKVEPYINHPLRVALILAEELQIHDTDIVCAALLHDALKEEGSVTEQDLKEQLGERVFTIVQAVTKPKVKTGDGNVDEKMLNEYFQSIANGSKDTRYVEIAERLDDVRSLKEAIYRDKIARFKEETLKYVVPIAEKTDEKLVLKLSVALYELK